MTGTFFHEQTVDTFIDAVKRCEAMSFDPAAAVGHAAAFGKDRFETEMGAFIDAALARNRGGSVLKQVAGSGTEPRRLPA